MIRYLRHRAVKILFALACFTAIGASHAQNEAQDQCQGQCQNNGQNNGQNPIQAVSDAAAPQVVIWEDDRQQSHEAAIGRLRLKKKTGFTAYCTAWQLPNGGFASAGHCFAKNQSNDCKEFVISAELQFNVPCSSDNGDTCNPPQSDIYPVDMDSVICYRNEIDGDTRSDWAVFSVQENSADQLPIENQKAFIRLSVQKPSENSTTTVTGYGADGPAPCYGSTNRPICTNQPKANCANATQNQFNVVQQTATGNYNRTFTSNEYVNLSYIVDTMPGDSGSPVIIDGLAVGIHNGQGEGCYNVASSFYIIDLEEQLQGYPGRINGRNITDSDNIIYVDAENNTDTQNGSIFNPYETLQLALVNLAALEDESLLEIISGSYPETGVDLTIILQADAEIDLPVGDVSVW